MGTPSLAHARWKSKRLLAALLAVVPRPLVNRPGTTASRVPLFRPVRLMGTLLLENILVSGESGLVGWEAAKKKKRKKCEL